MPRLNRTVVHTSTKKNLMWTASLDILRTTNILGMETHSIIHHAEAGICVAAERQIGVMLSG